ncbi:MAG: hypothetical protein ACE5R7_08320 [Nitrosarchaeum sp.]
MKKLFIISSIILCIPLIAYAESDQILITLSDTMNQIEFDGKWSFFTEWKRSSQDLFDNGNIVLRTAHQGDFIYVFIDNLSDSTPEKKLDYAIVCIDGKNDKSTLPDDNDYCFMGVLGNSDGFTYNGYSPSQNGNFRKVSNDPETVMIGGESDENDRYSGFTHSSYEFKIPIKLIGRENTYGFYFSTYDNNQKKIFHWPESSNFDKSHYIPSPSTWGKLISPDKSLPEFPLSLPVLAITMIVIVIVSKIKFDFRINS